MVLDKREKKVTKSVRKLSGVKARKVRMTGVLYSYITGNLTNNVIGNVGRIKQEDKPCAREGEGRDEGCRHCGHKRDGG